VIRIADQVDLVPGALRPRGAEALAQQRFQSVQGRVRQCRRGNAALRRLLRGGEEDVFIQIASLQPLPENDPVHRNVGQQPVMADSIKRAHSLMPTSTTRMPKRSKSPIPCIRSSDSALSFIP